MRKLWTVVAALISGAALILFAPTALAEQGVSPVDVEVELDLLTDNENLVGLPF